jgi:hypothetical protein
MMARQTRLKSQLSISKAHQSTNQTVNQFRARSTGVTCQENLDPGWLVLSLNGYWYEGGLPRVSKL